MNALPNPAAEPAPTLAFDEEVLYRETIASVAKMSEACGVPPDFRRMWFDAESALDDLRAAAEDELDRLRRIETAARAWHAARDAATSGGNWRPGAPARQYDDACDVLAAVLTVTAGGASCDDRTARIETAAREVLASGQAQYDRNLERLPDTEDLALEGRYVGDLVPFAKMTALRAAVEGEVAP